MATVSSALESMRHGSPRGQSGSVHDALTDCPAMASRSCAMVTRRSPPAQDSETCSSGAPA